MSICTVSAQPRPCAACALAPVCLPVAVPRDELALLDEIVQHRRPVARHAQVFRAGEPFDSLYVVRSGAIKSVKVTRDGEEQIVGLHLPGELFGLDGPGQRLRGTTAVALESSAICEVPYTRLLELGRLMPELNGYLIRTMSREINDEHHLLVLLSKRSAMERIASFLLVLSARQGRRGLSPTRFRLPFTRSDMANHLGLAIETVCRVLSRLQRAGTLKLARRELQILDIDRLQLLATAAQQEE